MEYELERRVDAVSEPPRCHSGGRKLYSRRHGRGNPVCAAEGFRRSRRNDRRERNERT